MSKLNFLKSYICIGIDIAFLVLYTVINWLLFSAPLAQNWMHQLRKATIALQSASQMHGINIRNIIIGQLMLPEIIQPAISKMLRNSGVLAPGQTLLNSIQCCSSTTFLSWFVFRRLIVTNAYSLCFLSVNKIVNYLKTFKLDIFFFLSIEFTIRSLTP